MSLVTIIKCLGIIPIVVLFTFCASPSEDGNSEESKELFKTTLIKHLDAISNRDLATLDATLHPDGKMRLILPGMEVTYTTEEFLKFHEEWFMDTTTWTIQSEIIETEIGTDMGIAIVEAMYKEPLRNGKPYFNKLHVSYALRKTAGNWYLVKDHACSLEKTQ